MKKFLLVAGCAALLAACGGGHFMSDRAYRDKVHADFEARRELAAGRSETLFGVLDGELAAERREALEFLYAYMPLCDLAEYDGAFFLRQVDGAFRARDYFSWGRSVPEDIFRHFVLVHRVNNEYLDEARDAFFEELKGRIKDMTMREAALEVNHWCHEKVTYRGSDARTSAALATVRTSWGRCGEESTFTTAALRAVGIPARQCYTPRWVHTDSNHAWVEVWIDGAWHYMGACEPEPELDVAWFDGPVQRAMMTHTTVYGLYNGLEEKNVETPLYSVINTLSVYAKTRRAEVRVVDESGAAVEGATVQYKVYNYGELYPMVTLPSDADGRAAIDTGMGDVMVWASDGTRYGYAKSTATDSVVTVALSRTAGEAYAEEYTMAAPAEQPFEELPAELIAANAVRLAREDSIRNAYMATFPTRDYAARVATETGLPEAQAWQWLNAAQGNWRDVEEFMRRAGSNPEFAAFMGSLREKDLRDTPADVLSDYLPAPAGAHMETVPAAMLARYVLSPRIGYELITPWRGYFADFFAANPQIGDAAAIIGHVSDNVRVSDADNYYNCVLTPRGVHELQIADARSRDIYFVALCRAKGIPARLDPANARPQYWTDGGWNDVSFGSGAAESAPSRKATLTIASDAGNIVSPVYGTHFTIARFEDGDFRTLELGGYFAGNANADMGGYGGAAFPAQVPVEEGYYRVMTASRANDGSATIAAQYITIGADGAEVSIKLPTVEGKLFVKGVVDMNAIVITDAGDKTTLKKLSRGRGAIVVFADPDKEPTKHILQEMPQYRQAIEQWGGAVVFMVPDDKRTEAFDPARFGGQPAQTVWATDTGRELLGQTAGALQLRFGNNFPLVVYLTNNGGILFSSEGYRIGILEDVLRTIKQEATSYGL